MDHEGSVELEAKNLSATAQELERRERDRQRHEEQRSFEALQAQYGMAEKDRGNFAEQTISGMQRAVFKGEMSVVDYYERQVGELSNEHAATTECTWCGDFLPFLYQVHFALLPSSSCPNATLLEAPGTKYQPLI